jgi:DNA-binding XRE family transcriptional regulator
MLQDCMTHPLTEARRRAGLSQQALADRVECDRQTILRIENCRQAPSLGLMAKIISALRADNVELSADAFLPVEGAA